MKSDAELSAAWVRILTAHGYRIIHHGMVWRRVPGEEGICISDWIVDEGDGSGFPGTMSAELTAFDRE